MTARHLVAAPLYNDLVKRLAAGAIVFAVGFGTTRLPAQRPPFPPALEAYVAKYVALAPADRVRLLNGQPVTRLLDADPSREVVVFGAVWVRATIDSYVTAVKDIETFERGRGFRITKKISTPPRIADFDKLTLDEDDAADLRTCRIGRCEMKLSAESIQRIRREVDWTKPAARADLDRITREIALEYVTGYLDGGNARLAVYRDADRPTFVATEFQAMITRLPALTEFLPDLRRYLLEFPSYTLPKSESFLYWQEVQFGLKPTIRINHVVVNERPNGVVVASKMLYANHYFWTALELRMLILDEARKDGFWFVSVNRSRSDGLSGFFGRVIRGKVRAEAERGMAAVLAATKSTLEDH